MNQCDYIDLVEKLKKELKEYRDTGIEPYQVKLIQDDNKFLQEQNKGFRNEIDQARKITTRLLNENEVLKEAITKIVDDIHETIKAMPEGATT